MIYTVRNDWLCGWGWYLRVVDCHLAQVEILTTVLFINSHWANKHRNIIASDIWHLYEYFGDHIILVFNSKIVYYTSVHHMVIRQAYTHHQKEEISIYKPVLYNRVSTLVNPSCNDVRVCHELVGTYAQPNPTGLILFGLNMEKNSYITMIKMLKKHITQNSSFHKLSKNSKTL